MLVFYFSHHQFKIWLSLVIWNNFFLFHLFSTVQNLIAVVSLPIVFVLVCAFFFLNPYILTFSGF